MTGVNAKPLLAPQGGRGVKVVLGVDQGMDADELTTLEARLAETGGLRPALQAQARAELTAEGMPVIRSTVARRACAILDLRDAR